MEYILTVRSNKFIIVLFFSVVLILCPKLAFPQASGSLQNLTENQKLARDIFRELIEINTTANMGSTKAVEAMAARLKDEGFPEADIKIVGPSPQNMNLVARLKGKGTLPPLLFIGHLDVVEALPQDWSFDPFIFREIEGYFYGRGTTDMKNEDADLIVNLIRLKKEGFIPERDIIIALTDHEEGGSANGIQWLIANRRDLIGHSSLPLKDNAIYHLSEALINIAGYDFPLDLNETTRMFFERNAQQESGQTRADMMAVAKIPPDTSAANRLAGSSAHYNSLMRTTCVATIITAGHANNALPQTARANVNCRLLPDDNQINVLNTLINIVNDPQVRITCSYAANPGPMSPLRKDVLDAVDHLTDSMWPGVIVTPIMATGATDGKRLRSAGIPVYGISGMFGDVDDVRAHGKDERIGVQEFYNGIEFMYRLMKELSSDILHDKK
ncbi:MAG: M20/M25/M40 family metallo-hydrolase [Bacteroidia bacterium]|nr:M20/M25/M40 family metallo-hydrolase [Bacteroidia bacterium]